VYLLLVRPLTGACMEFDDLLPLRGAGDLSVHLIFAFAFPMLFSVELCGFLLTQSHCQGIWILRIDHCTQKAGPHGLAHFRIW
jgi:hypothetical protein